MYGQKHYSNVCSAEEKSQVWKNQTGVLSNESMHRSKADQIFLQRIKIKAQKHVHLPVIYLHQGGSTYWLHWWWWGWQAYLWLGCPVWPQCCWCWPQQRRRTGCKLGMLVWEQQKVVQRSSPLHQNQPAGPAERDQLDTLSNSTNSGQYNTWFDVLLFTLSRNNESVNRAYKLLPVLSNTHLKSTFKNTNTFITLYIKCSTF